MQRTAKLEAVLVINLRSDSLAAYFVCESRLLADSTATH